MRTVQVGGIWVGSGMPWLPHPGVRPSCMLSSARLAFLGGGEGVIGSAAPPSQRHCHGMRPGMAWGSAWRGGGAGGRGRTC